MTFIFYIDLLVVLNSIYRLLSLLTHSLLVVGNLLVLTDWSKLIPLINLWLLILLLIVFMVCSYILTTILSKARNIYFKNDSYKHKIQSDIVPSGIIVL